MADFLTTLSRGLGTGGLYALVAIGYNIIFLTTNVLNFAHGQLVMVGAILSAVALAELGAPVLAVPALVIVVGAVLGAIEERFAVRPVIARYHAALGWVLATFGFSIVIEAIFAIIFTPNIRTIPGYLPGAPIDLSGILILPQHLLVLGAATVLMVALTLFLRRTDAGRAFAAVAQNPDAAALRGVPVRRVSTLAFALGGGIAGLTGFLALPLTGAYPALGLVFAFKGFIAAAVGGIPDIRGALLGGLLLGGLEALTIRWVGVGYREVATFVVLVIVLVARPAGVFGIGAVREV